MPVRRSDEKRNIPTYGNGAKCVGCTYNNQGYCKDKQAWAHTIEKCKRVTT